MSALTFVIPTRGRARQLSAAVRSIAEQIGNADVGVVVLYNKGEQDTERAIARCSALWPQVASVGVDGAPEYSTKFRAMMRVAYESEWVWTFGDDDRLQPGALKFMLGRLESAQPELSFIHVCEVARSTGTGHTFTGRLIDLCCSLGWLEMTGFITGNITRGLLLAQCSYTGNWPTYAKSAFVHSCAILETLKEHQAQFIDLPLVDTQEREQSAMTMERWAEERTAERYFYVAHAIKDMMERGVLTTKLPPKFFRYMHYHLWDRHMTYFLMNAINGALWEAQWADSVKLLADLVDDPAVAEGIRRDVDESLRLATERAEAQRLVNLRIEEMRTLYMSRAKAVYDDGTLDARFDKKVA